MDSESKNEELEEFSPTTKMVVESLKEIVNHCTEREICAVLKECKMDPDRAAQQLLSQDTFQEVKSKRDRRKETKDSQESFSQGNSNGLNRGARVNNGSHNVGQIGPTKISYNELSKTANGGGKGSVASSISSSRTLGEGKAKNQSTFLHSDPFSSDNRRQLVGTVDPMTPLPQLSPGCSSPQLGATSVRPSMADVLKMGRQQKDSQMLTVVSCTPQDLVIPNSSLYYAKPPHVSANWQQELHQDLDAQRLSNMSEAINEAGVSTRHHAVNDTKNTGGTSDCDNNTLKDINFCSSRMPFEQQEETLHRLSLRNEEPTLPIMEDNCGVIFPNHLQALAADCSQLSFGTYRAGSNTALSEPSEPNPLKLDVGKASAAIDGLYQHLLSRDSGHSGDEQLISMYDTPTVAADPRNYDLPPSSRSELMERIIPETTVEHEFISKLYLSDSDFNDAQRPTSVFSFARADSQNVPAFSSNLHTHSDTRKSGLLGSSIKSQSDDLPCSQFPVTQSTPLIHKNAGSPSGSSTNPMLKVLKPAAFSPVQPSSVHPHLIHQPYSQHNPTLEQQLANEISYLSLTQSNVNRPLDRTYSGNSAYNQPLAGTRFRLPNYDNGDSSSRLPLPAPNASRYGGFGTSTNSGRFLPHPSADLRISYGEYNDVLPSHYAGGDRFTPFQQRDSFSAWDYGSRMMSHIPDLVDSNQLSDIHQSSQRHSQHQSSQRHSQHHGARGYPNFFYS